MRTGGSTPGRLVRFRGLAGRALTASGLLGCVLVPPPPAAAQYSVSPVIVSVPREPAGASSSGMLAIRNEGAEPMHFRLFVADFDQSFEGVHDFFEPGTHPGSCGDGVRVTPDVLSIDPGQTARVRFEVPGGAFRESCWSMVFVESPTTSDAGVTINQRIGVKLFGVGAGTAPGGEVDAEVTTLDDGSRVVTLDYRNPGKAPARPAGSIEFRDYRGTRVASAVVRPFTVLPDGRRRVVVEVPPDLASGRYLAIPVLDFGGDQLAGTQVPFSVP